MLRKFYIVGHPNEEEEGNAVALEAHSFGKFDYTSLMRGERLKRLPAELRLEVGINASEFARANVVICPFGWKVISQELGTPLEKIAKEDVELLQVPVWGQDGIRLPKQFFVINALKILEATSETKSIRSAVMLGSSYPVLKPCVKSKDVPSDVHVFRLRGDEMRLLVDEIGKRALSSAQHDGLKFLPVCTE